MVFVRSVLGVAAADLLGSFPTAAVVGGARGRDPAREGSANPGASNMYRLAGARAGAVVLLGDMAKGALAATGGLATGAAAVVGHCFPLWQRRGGRGVATAAGMTLMLFPLAFAAGAAVWVAAAALTRTASVASLAAAAAIPAVVALVGHAAGEVAGVAAVAGLIVLRHRDNVVRLWRGEEHRLVSTRTRRR